MDKQSLKPIQQDKWKNKDINKKMNSKPVTTAYKQIVKPMTLTEGRREIKKILNISSAKET